MEGTRPMLIEIQALVSRAEADPPRRVVNGIDRNRLSLILAVLGRHAGLSLSGHDVFVNVVGGVRIEEPSADLAVALAVASAARNAVLASEVGSGQRKPLVCFGEIGLTGELRPVPQADRRVAEAVKFGLTHTLFPAPRGDSSGAHSVREALARAFDES
jgi:DNA repair protein RadA/Sms